MPSTKVPKVVPAHLSFLAIYNPSLSSSDETFHQQIVFYYTKAARSPKTKNANPQAEQELRDEENEKLRQVGLAQGMVGFARSFSSGEPVDSIETHKSRIILYELEQGWWVLASISLTQLPAANSASKPDSGNAASTVEYSSREVSPPALLIQQLIRTHTIFLLHHGATLQDLFSKHGRVKFCNILDKYWSRFATTWDVLLHGSPAVEMYGGMKLAAGGELGMGVGEEEWGSGERDVLEDFARRTEGLVDIMVSRFGEASPLQQAISSTNLDTPDVSEMEPWIGSGKNASAADGVVFSGLGALSRKSLRDVSHWVESIYCYGDQAYGVRDNPTSDRRKWRRRNLRSVTEDSLPETPPPTQSIESRTTHSHADSDLPIGIPPPIVKAVENSLDKAVVAVDTAKKSSENTPHQNHEPLLASLGNTEIWMKYMTLGYGTAWGGKRALEDLQTAEQQPVPERTPSPEAMRYVEPEPDVDLAGGKLKLQIRQENDGYFLIGLKGDMGDANTDADDEEDWDNRILLRTMHVDVVRKESSLTTPGVDPDVTSEWEREMSFRATASKKLSRLRPIVYVHRPFIYTFLFDQQATALSMASFYRHVHRFFSPLHRLLDKNTSPERVALRLTAAANPYTTVSSTSGSELNTQIIYDLVYDPRTLTVHSSLPNIPDPGTLIAEGLSSNSINASGWSRVEALNVHSQILATVADTRRNLCEIERTCKTSRGWWVVWMRLAPSQVSEDAVTTVNSKGSSQAFNTDELREAFLVRRARDAVPATAKSSGSRFASGMWAGMGMGGSGQSQRMGGAAAGWGPKGLADGIGIDARKYVDELLSLNR
ncbi:hypothetical protein P153DRAFT_345102 [Dothidotthia symphoricarpi CBS 119687]|uniref:CCZ1/INTU/HSP4 first Longin domain-containing protein n=1 Tax=Dothidotthia symphoricarpi CBS 119687 TaxID=1392245 RepID=A0A6A6A9A8_9PLEO|nr:uncharacterized protein P153DRAFT_345102 [Dothidotthia symphoricarpi CBS 119687]KAF2127428.1 hypothetical protein P153DRAFT_345102 [Dothidotthia symphoricarpi CBS 119687]